MTREDVFQGVVRVLQSLQSESGREVEDIDGNTRPIGGLAGFDSHAGLEFSCALEVTLKIEVSLDENLCVDDAKRCARTVDEIVDRVVEIQKGA